MKGLCQSWVTTALTDVDAFQSLCLAKSLRRTFTSKKLTIIISEKVSASIRHLLKDVFDFVERVDSDAPGMSGCNEDTCSTLVGIQCFNLRGWNKCVFLRSNFMVMENCDYLFDFDVLSAVVNKKVEGRFLTDLFVFRPNSFDFENLVTITKIKEGNGEDLLNDYFQDWKFGGINRHINPNNIIIVDFTNPENWDIGTITPRLVQFQQSPWMYSSIGEIGVQRLTNHWLNIFQQDVLPIVAKYEDGVTKKSLIQSMIDNGLRTDTDQNQLPPQPSNVNEYSDTIAIVGMSCRFPGANNPDEFWKILAEGVDGISEYPVDRPPPMTLDDDNASDFQAGFLKCPIDEFDAKFFRISPKEAPFIDPQQRLLLEVSWEALENAGINPQSLRDSNTSMFTGIWQADYARMFTNESINTNDFHHRYLGNAFSATSSRLSHFLGLNGPNAALESGCSSSLQGLHSACESIRSGESDISISAGINIVLSTFNLITEDGEEGSFLSKDFRCKTFDESANGFVRAEGCGVLILKRYGDARRDGDNVLALIRGSAYNNCGGETSFGTPNATSQIQVMQQALKNSSVDPSEISVVEAHGTGTAVGDPTEMYAIGKAYSVKNKRTEPLIVTSVKSNIGHTEACAGIAGVIKIILSMKHNAIPPNLHLKTLNHRIDLDSIPAQIPMELTEWKCSRRIAGVSSFGLSGTNVHVIIEEPPEIENMYINNALASVPDTPQVLTISAKSEDALDELRLSYIKLFQEDPTLKIEDVAFLANTGRAHLPYAIAAVGKDIAQLTQKLQQRTYIMGKAPSQRNKIGFIFPGQGSQYFGMAKTLYSTSSVFKRALDRCAVLFEFYFTVSLQDVLWHDPQKLARTIYCQPSIFCVQYALLQMWTSFGIQPDVVIGHSVGEYCAAVSAGVLGLEDAMMLVVRRSQLVNELAKGEMVAVRGAYKEVETIINEFNKGHQNIWVDIAAINSTDEVIVSGSEESIDLFVQSCSNNALLTQPLEASHPFHSRAMDSVVLEFGEFCKVVKTNRPSCTFVSATTAKVMEAEDFTCQYWTNHLRDTVRFSDAIRLVYPECKVLLEIGTQPILLGLTLANFAETLNATFCPSLRKNEEDSLCMLTSLSKLFVAGVNIEWSGWFGGIRQKQLILPTYPFQREKFWCHDCTRKPSIGIELHPILGRQLPCPLPNTIFYNNLRMRNMSYIADHKVAEHVIIPAAAYLETIMAAGREIIQAGNIQIALTVENFEVDAAINIDPDRSCNIQTVVESRITPGLNDGPHYDISLYKQLQLDKPDNWMRHSSATFSPCTTLSTIGILDIKNIKDRLEYRAGYPQTLYKEIAAVGIKFGPKFQSIVEAWSSQAEQLTEIYQPQQHEKYICHPIVLDAMIQSFAYRSGFSLASAEQKELLLPVRIKKFIWLAREPSDKMYVYIMWDSNGEGDVCLCNESGEQLAKMEGLEFISTNAESFLRALPAASINIPDFLATEWRQTLGVTEFRADVTTLQHVTTFSQLTAASLAELDQDLIIYSAKADRLSFCYLLRSIQECAWPWPPVGTVLTVHDWISWASSNLNIKFLEAIIHILTDEGYIESSTSKIILPLPTIDECTARIQDEISSISNIEAMYGVEDISNQFLKRCLNNLSNVFTGKMTAVSLLFPDNENEVGAIRFYTESRLYQVWNNITTAVLLDSVTGMVGKGVLRILEVGAGSGTICDQVTRRLSEMGISYQYTYTDISSILVSRANQKFDDKNISCEVLDIEKDPLSQGFAPGYFDIVLGSLVVHATANLSRSVLNLRKLIRIGGQLILTEQFRTEYKTLLTFGMLDGYWRFDDFRTTSPLVGQEAWETVFRDAGFDSINNVNFLDEGYGVVTGIAKESLSNANIPAISPQSYGLETKIWVLFSDKSEVTRALNTKLEEVGRNVILVTLTDSVMELKRTSGEYLVPASKFGEGLASLFETLLLELTIGQVEGVIYMCTENNSTQDIQYVQKNSAGGFLYLCQALSSTFQKIKSKPKVVLLSRGVHYIGDDEAGNPNAATLWGMFKTFGNENQVVTCAIDLEEKKNPQLNSINGTADEVQEAFAQIWKLDNEYSIAIRNGKKYFQRVSYTERNTPVLHLPNVPRFKVLNPESGNFGDLQIVPVAQQEVGGKDIEVAVMATALNFKDIFVILKPEGFELPKGLTTEIGLDFAGTIVSIGSEVTRWKIGDEVFGLTMNGALASHVRIAENEVMRKPAHLTFAGAATLPVAFGTAYHALVNLAKLRPDDSILIHVASGGVGIAAIRLAQHVGARIFATAGSRRKRAYLTSLGIKYIYHSRNTNFGKDIENATSGNGVSVVLNCLTGPKFKETSLSLCRTGARFIEIGKINTWTTEEVYAIRPDVLYYYFDLGIVLEKEGSGMDGIRTELDKRFSLEEFQAIPHVTFPLDQLKHAFNYFQEAKHIGKVVITIPKPVQTTGSNERFQLQTDLFNRESTYLITGGLGGLGMEVCHWMTTRGAHHVVLVGRNGPKPRALELIRSWNEKGANVLTFEVDVGEYDQCGQLLQDIKTLGLPPLRGIMHAAGVISDSLIPNQTWESYTAVFRPKVYGAWYLHSLTKHNYDLEFFNMFSSAAAIAGAMGQSNHAGANYYLDSLAHYRNSLGMPATSVNWGPWSDVGAAAHITLTQYHILGVRAITPIQGITALEKIMKSPQKQVAVLDVADWNVTKQLFGQGKLLDEMSLHMTTVEATLERYKKLADDIKASPAEERKEKIETYLTVILRETLRLPEKEIIDPDQNFSEMGVDSLMAMEMRNRLRGILDGKSVTLTALQANRTIRSLSTYLTHILNSEETGTLPAIPIFQLLKEDSILPADIMPTGRGPLKPSQFKTILLTGATGHLGSHILANLLETHLKVYALIRADSEEAGRVRLMKALKRQGLGQVALDNVTIVTGNVVDAKLGLGDKYDILNEDIDAIIHCAVKSNHLENYCEGGENDMRSNNVIGLVNMLRFAGIRKTKPFLHASTLIATMEMTSEGLLSEEYPSQSASGDKILNGYVLTKFMGDKLVSEASNRGFPVTTLRFPPIFGHSVTGFIPDVEISHGWNLILTCIKVQMFPKLSHQGFALMAVDSAALITTKLFLSDSVERGVYNLTTDTIGTEDLITDLKHEYELPMRFVPFPEWRDEILKLDGGGYMGPLIKLYEDEDGESGHLNFHPLGRTCASLKLNVISLKLKRNIPDIEHILLPAKVILQRHLNVYFNAEKRKKQKLKW